MCLCLEVICAIVIPPLGVCFHYGCCGLEFWLSLVLTILGWLPGVIYALYVILCYHRRRVDIDDHYYLA